MSFSSGVGAGAAAGLTLSPDGTIYGVSGEISGTLCKFTPGAGAVVNLAQLPDNYTGRASPVAIGDDGNLYGTTEEQFYRVTPAGELTVLIQLNGLPVGRSPSGRLLKTGDGGFLVTCATGGNVSQNVYGTVQRLSEGGTATPVCNFPPLLGRAFGELSEIGGRLYGTVGDDGTPHLVNEHAPEGAFSFSLNDPAQPAVFNFLFLGDAGGTSALVPGPDGNVYGTLSYGGYSDASGDAFGLIYTLLASGRAGIAYQFAATNNGETAPHGTTPMGALTPGPDGQLYGTTESGGANGLGTFFRYDPATRKLVTLASFAAASGSYPTGDLILSDGVFYGRAGQGGDNNTGTFFSVTPQGRMTALASFEAGRYMLGPLVLANDGNFYGTSEGGINTPDENVSVIRLTKAGGLSTVTTLDKDLGLDPVGVMQASDGNFYGATEAQYNGLPGTIYRMDPNGAVTKLHTFSAAEGLGAAGNLIEGSDGYLYGSTPVGGPSRGGTIYRLTVLEPRLVNIATRVRVQTAEQKAIGGFIITGSGSKKVLLRAIGPSLGYAGISDSLANPVLELHAPDGSLITQNDDWKVGGQQAQIEATGLAPGHDAESAIIADLAPGGYTAAVAGKDGGSGLGLIEVYDLDMAGAPAKLANISTRGFVGGGSDVMIGGVIAGKGNMVKTIIRALGPSLENSGVTGALSDPVLELHDANGAVIVANDNWQDDPAHAARISSSGLAPKNALESAIVATLPPGGTTAVVKGKSGTGVALVEVYDVD